MMTKKRNAFVALLLVFSMVISMIPTNVVSASDTLPTEGFTVVTPAMFGIENYSGNAANNPHTSTKKPIPSADKMMLKANVIFGASWDGFWIFDKSMSATPASGYGIGIERTGGTNFVRVYHGYHGYTGKIYLGGEFIDGIYTGGEETTGIFRDLNLGVDISTTAIEFAVTTEVVDFDKDGTADDMKIGIWVNGNLKNEGYWYFLDFTISADEIALFTDAQAITSPDTEPLPEPEPEPEPEPAVPTISNDFVQVTPRDFGMADYSNNDSNVTKYGTAAPRSTADKMVFKTKILMGSGKILRLFHTGDDLDAETGIVFWVNSRSFRVVNRCSPVGYFLADGTTEAKWFQDVDLGVDVTTTAVDLAVTTEFVDFDSDGKKDDMKIGIWINEVLNNNTYLYAQDCYITSEDTITFTTNAKAVTSPEPKTDGVVEVTPQSFGIDNFTDNTNGTLYTSTKKPVKSIDKMVLKANVVFGGNWKGIQLFDMSGGTTPTGGHGITIANSGGQAIRVYNWTYGNIYYGGSFVNGVYTGGEVTGYIFYDFNAGVDLSATENEITITTDVVDMDQNGVADLRLGIFINGNLPSGYLYFKDFAVKPSNVCVITDVVSIRSPKVLEVPETLRPITLPEDFEQATFETFGIENYTNNTSYTTYTSTLKPIVSSDKMLFKTNAIFGNGGITLFDRTATGTISHGFHLGNRNGNLALYNMNEDGNHIGYNVGEYVDGAFSGGFVWFYTMELGVNLTTTELQIQITTETVDVNQDGTPDTKIGIWFGGTLYNDTYLYALGQTFNRDQVFAATSVLSMTSPKLPKPPVLPKDFTEVTPGDFGIADFKGNTSQKLYQSTTAPITSADKMLFKANVTFGTVADSGMWLFDATGEGSNRSSFGLFAQEDGSLRLSNYYNGNTIWVGDKYEVSANNGAWVNWYYDIYPDINLEETAVAIAITTEAVDFDKDGNKDDLKMGIWINETLYNKKYFYVRDCAIAAENIYFDTNVLEATSPFGYTVQMDITDSLVMNYIVKLNGTVSNPQMTFKMNGQNKKADPVAVAGQANTYKFTLANIMAQDMAANIEAILTVGSRVETKNYSVLDYCADLLLADEAYANDGTKYTEEEMVAMKELVVDLVQYGTEVQTYRADSNDEALTAQLAAKVPNYEDFENMEKEVADLANLTAVASKLTQESGATTSNAYAWTGVGLVLNNKVKIRGTFTANDISNLTIKVVVDGVELDKALTIKATSTANKYTVDFDEIYAYEYGKEISFRFYNGTTHVGKTLNYSVNTYLKEMSTYSDGLAQLLVAICNYGDAACAVKNQAQ